MGTCKLEQKSDDGVHGWQIAIIVVACFFFVVSIIALMWAIYEHRARKGASSPVYQPNLF